ncbi:Flp pilus assembly protein CpaB [Vibrio kasasachensis]|uniref:Flp pilus assembly protein CpaB n=1 Tax=Vibrio kasasachensis TaxID=2910248 RepID=UPI003D0CED92
MRSKVLMIVAIVAILAGLFGLYFAKGESVPTAIIEEPADVIIKAYVLSKNRAFKSDTVDRSDFKIVNLSEKEANKQGLNSDVLFDFEPGSVYKKSIQKGKYVFVDDIVQPSEPNYIEFIIADDHVPYPIQVSPSAVVGGVIGAGAYIDVLALTGQKNKDSELGREKKEQVSISPVLTNIKVLKVEINKEDSNFGAAAVGQSYLILELDRKQVAILTIAKTISTIEVHKTVGNYPISELQANAGDVLPDFKAIKELRAEKIVVN